MPGDLLSFAAYMDSMPVTCMGTCPCEPHPCFLLTTHCALPAQDRLQPSATPLDTLPAPGQEHVASQGDLTLLPCLLSQPRYRCTYPCRHPKELIPCRE